MSVDLVPAELGFKRPFTQEVAQNLRLHNPNGDEVAFKVKTTAPKQYCVRPNSGRIPAGESVDVQVLLQAMKEDPPLDTRCRDKFLVQSVAIRPEHADTNITQIWSSLEQTAKSAVSEKKIRVNFLSADNTPSIATNGVAHHDDESGLHSPPSPIPVTPQRHSASVASPISLSTTDKSPSGAPSSSTPLQSSLSSATAAIASVTGQTQEDVNRQLTDAKTKIAQLQAQLSEGSGLRQRKPADVVGEKSGSSGSTTTLQQSSVPGGVPVLYVFLLCLLSFLIAYLLF